MSVLRIPTTCMLALVAGACRSDAGIAQPAPYALAAQTWSASRPTPLGMLAGHSARYANANVTVAGSDMASSFEHAGKIVLLFGDTWSEPMDACTPFGGDDDMLGTLPLERSAELPALEIATRPSAPNAFARVQLWDAGRNITLGSIKIPITGWSDGNAAFAIFQPQEPVSCGDAGTCPAQAGVRCVQDLSLCYPGPPTVPANCDPLRPTCLLGNCKPAALCVDTHSSQYDGTARGNVSSILSTLYIAKARSEDITTFDTLATWRTNVFSHPAARTVKHFSGSSQGSDYAPGSGDLLIWGRPGLSAEQGRESRLYLASAHLPLTAAERDFRPNYFAGVDAQGEPRWSDDPAAAVALAMDGKVSGDPHESQAIVGTTTVSWLGAPINRWIMLYGGDLPDNFLWDAARARSDSAQPASIVLRFAEHPWGPWSPAVLHLSPGSPKVVGDAYGPGGILFNAACVDDVNARCARTDAYSLSLLGTCVMQPSPDPGRLYAPAIIDAYTRENTRGGLDIAWTVSTWLPYATYLMQTSIEPDSQSR